MDTMHMTTATNDGIDVPVVVTYEVIGFYRVNVTDIRADMPGEVGPNIIDAFDSDEVADDICSRLEWKKEPRYRGDN